MSAYFIDGRKTIKTILTENIALKGELSFEESLEIHGTFSGTIRSKGLLVIGKTATINGDIYSRDLIVEGKVVGNILAYNRLSVEAEAEIFGNIVTHKIKVTHNVSIEGDCSTESSDKVKTMFDNVAPKEFFRSDYVSKPVADFKAKNPIFTASSDENIANPIRSVYDNSENSTLSAPPLKNRKKKK